MRYVSFDIEIADEFELKPGEDLLDHAPFHLSVAATVDGEGQQPALVFDRSGRQALPSDGSVQGAGAAGIPATRLQQKDVKLFAWNGLSFDLRWIGHNAGDMETAARVALGLYDPMFQFFNQRGFPVGLAAVGDAMGVRQTKLMDSADAPREWRKGNYQRVMDYVVGDCQITNQIVEAIAPRGCLSWRTKSGTLSSEPMPRLQDGGRGPARPGTGPVLDEGHGAETRQVHGVAAGHLSS